MERIMNNYFVWVEITANTERILDANLFSEAMEKCAQRGIDSVVLSVKDTTGFVLYNSTTLFKTQKQFQGN